MSRVANDASHKDDSASGQIRGRGNAGTTQTAIDRMMGERRARAPAPAGAGEVNASAAEGAASATEGAIGAAAAEGASGAAAAEGASGAAAAEAERNPRRRPARAPPCETD